MPTTRLFAIGVNFGLWTIISASCIHTGKRSVLCRCRCGIERYVRTSVLSRGKSNGCRNCRMAIVHFKTHGMSRTPEYNSWHAMIERCYNRSNHAYRLYGARGIRVCKQWRTSPEQFLADMGPRPVGMTLERRNPTGNYDPDNCCWATRHEQNRNTSRNRLLTFKGQTLCVAEWANELGINKQTIISRLWQGWSIERTLSTPARKHKPYKARS